MTIIRDVHGDIGTVLEKEHLMSRGGKALCERSVSRLKSLMDEAERQPPLEDVPDKTTVSQAAAIIAAQATGVERKSILGMLQAIESAEQRTREVNEFRALVGTP